MPKDCAFDDGHGRVLSSPRAALPRTRTASLLLVGLAYDRQQNPHPQPLHPRRRCLRPPRDRVVVVVVVPGLRAEPRARERGGGPLRHAAGREERNRVAVEVCVCVCCLECVLWVREEDCRVDGGGRLANAERRARADGAPSPSALLCAILGISLP